MSLTPEEKRLIQEEEELFHKTLDFLFSQLPIIHASKVEASQTARELTRQVNAERNNEAREPMISEETVAHRLVEIRKDSEKNLLELVQEPYFGRVITSEEDGSEVSFLIGKKSHVEAGIVDWRNGPISSLYFNYKQGEEFYEVINNRERAGRIKVRRSFKVENGGLVQIDLSDDVFQRTGNGWEKLDVESQIVAHRSRRVHSREKKLPSILSLIDKDQFEMITTDPDRPVIIQGSAGSGKTTVALHRLAWLLHDKNSNAQAENTKVLVMNKTLQIYVGSTLPSMGIEGVETTTFNSWALSIIRKCLRKKAFFKFHNLPAFVEEIKYSEGILKALNGYVDRQAGNLDEGLQRQLGRWPAILSNWNKSSGQPVLSRVRDLMHEVKKSNLPNPEIREALDILKAKMDRLEDYIADLFDLLSDSEFLAKYLAPHPKMASQLQYLKRLAEKNRAKNQLDYFDMSLILRTIQLKNGGLPGTGREPVALDHLVIDEAQDFGPVEYAIMVNSVNDPRHLTIVGDVSQKIHFSRKFIGWEKIIDTLNLDEDDLIRLEVSFRCTAPIMSLARKVEGNHKPVSGRPGKPVEWKRAQTKSALLEEIGEWVDNFRREDPNILIAIICRYPKQAMVLREDLKEIIPDGLRLGHRSEFSFEPGVIVTNVHQVKGLEFDAVAIMEPNEENYPSARSDSRNLLYVALTRAQDDLLLATTKPFSKILI